MMPQAIAAWKEAVDVAADARHTGRSIADPALWERIAYMRPVTAAWPTAVAHLHTKPDAVVVQASAAEPNGNQSSANETILWAMIGEWRLRRAEPQGALLAFKHAEGFATEEISHDRLQVGEARALAAMGQRSSAVAILTRLMDNPNPRIGKPALAVYGSMLFNEGQTTQAHSLLLKALEGGNGWPEAEAELGLACLISGEETEGLSHLRQAQKAFEAAGEFELLQQSLWNEAAYLDQIKKPAEANTVRQRSLLLETRN